MVLFYLPIDRTLIRCYHSGPEWTWERWQWRDTPHSPKLQHCWNLTIILFSVISGHLLGGGSYPSAEKQSVYSTAPADWADVEGPGQQLTRQHSPWKIWLGRSNSFGEIPENDPPKKRRGILLIDYITSFNYWNLFIYSFECFLLTRKLLSIKISKTKSIIQFDFCK